MSQIAVIYARVSSAKQVSEGSGLDSQATRCRDFAERKGYSVVHVFTDDITGKLSERPGMEAMLAFLRSKRREHPIVLIDDISRLARGLEAHLKLRADIGQAGGRLESPTLEFGSDSDSQLVEHLLASVSQHQRQKNGEQTLNRMRARMMNGYWVHPAPVGYIYQKQAGHGKVLVPDPATASILTEALEGFASGRFGSQAEVQTFLEDQPAYPCRLSNGKVHPSRVTELLSRVIYAGYIESSDWGITRRKGHHAPLISLTTFEKIQECRQGRAIAPKRADLDQDFILRGAACCADCGVPLRSSWSKGAKKRYAYYLCQTKTCESYGKSIPRNRIEGEFEDYLRSLTPMPSLFDAAKIMVRDAWEAFEAQSEQQRAIYAAKRKNVEKQIDTLLKRIVVAENERVIKAYETKLAALENEKLLLDDKAQSLTRQSPPFEEALEHVLGFLASPWKVWEKGDYAMRRTILKLVLAKPWHYHRKTGARTPEKPLLFSMLTGDNNPECQMVRSRRLELPRELPHSDLNAARLPIPPRPHCHVGDGRIATRSQDVKRKNHQPEGGCRFLAGDAARTWH